MRTPLALVVALMAAAPACSNTPEPEAVVSKPIPSGILGPGDVFEVRVYGEPELSGVHRVAPDNTIDIPLVGRVEVNRMTGAQLNEVLIVELARYVRNPQISIFVKEFNSQKVFVFGEVQRAGTFKFEEGMNIVQAITLAGGFAKLADKNGTYVTRLVDGREKKIEVAVEDIGEGEVSNLLLEPGDIVYVPEALF